MKLYNIDKIKTTIEASIEATAFRAPYDGTDNFYDQKDLEAFERLKNNFLSTIETLPSDLLSPWNHVDDRLPEKTGMYLIAILCTDGYHVSQQIYLSEIQKFYGQIQPSYWAYMIEPPNFNGTTPNPNNSPL